MRILRLCRHALPLGLVLATLAAGELALPPEAAAQAVGISITLAPPPLPIYAQPPLPAPGYLWIPGYWAYGPNGYYWVPGTWVEPPEIGLLWTPGYWAWADGFYLWHAGYWGPRVGYYGGINYGYGYFGTGYSGGRWENGHFAYNQAVNNFGRVHVADVYRQDAPRGTANRVSFSGGSRGSQVRVTPQEESAAHEQPRPATAVQAQHEHGAGGTHGQLASVNHGRPPVAATSHPGQFHGRGVVAARGPAPRPAPHPAAVRPAAAHPAGNPPRAQPQPGGHDEHHP
jgi:hypothetical protein